MAVRGVRKPEGGCGRVLHGEVEDRVTEKDSVGTVTVW